ncbi:MAG: paraquat-inducible protein A [Terracidiphilus sp.]
MITNVENGGTATDAPVGGRGRMFQLRLAVAALLLVPAIWFSFETVTGLASRRVLRTDLAEIEHARYGILSADQWRAIIGPMLDAQVDKLDLKSESKSLRPMVERSLYALLDNIKTQMTSPAAKTAPGSPGAKAPATQPGTKAQAPPAAKTPGFPLGGLMGSPMIVNMIINSLRPHVPEYTDVVMTQLTKPETEKSFKDSIRGVLASAVANTFGHTDMTTYNAILRRYGCQDGTACEQTLNTQIAAADQPLNRDYLIVLGSAALGFILLLATKSTLTRAAVVVLMLFSITMLVGGVLSPMLEVEVRVSKLDATLLGTPFEFNEQSLYYRSKTVLEVFQTLIQSGRPEMTLVGVLVILFSVVFPALKMLALGASLFKPALLRSSRLVRLLAFDLSKWSMADVMVLAIFMSFVAFNSVIGSALGGLHEMPQIQQVRFPTDSSQILPGYYLFIGFCISSIVLSKRLERGIADGGGPSH